MTTKFFNIDKDAFSNGQIASKLWLCEELENLFDDIDTVVIYAGWYALTAFLLKSRDRIKIKMIRSYDIDPACEPVADMINENWVFQEWHFKAFTHDCSDIYIEDVDLIINTSTEHFDNMIWFDNIPHGTYVALQGNNMPHDDHHVYSHDLQDFIQKYPLSNILYQGEKEFKYPDWQFKRYMVIGKK